MPYPLTRVAAYAVHLFTASGVACAFLSIVEICKPAPDARVVFALLGLQVLIDALDGPMARAIQIKKVMPTIDGRTIDDLVDYLTYTFVPLTLVWKMQWLPSPGEAWVIPAMIASLFGFANTGAKDEGGGFFLGFPSYWNIVALYLGAWHWLIGPWPGALLVATFTILTVLPVRFVYPNLAPRPWRLPLWIGAVVWTALLAWIVARYPTPPGWLIGVSLFYPVWYLGLSVWLDVRARRLARMQSARVT